MKFGTRAMESMGIFSLISVGAGSCPNCTKQPPTLQNKSRGIWLLSGEQVDVHMLCKGAGDCLLHSDKKVIPGNWNSVKTGRSAAWAAEAAAAGTDETGI